MILHAPLRTLLLALLLGGAPLAHAQTAPHAPPARSGDAWVDGRLVDMTAYAGTYRDAFVDELVRYRRAPRELVEELLARPGWTAGDVYFACSLAMEAGRPCRSAADARGDVDAGDWSRVAADFGVAPGSAGFHALKRGIVASYDRWARPIAVDAELAPDFPQRPQAAPARHPPREEHPAARRRSPGAVGGDV